MDTLKVIAALLHYPDMGLYAHEDELIAVVEREGLLKGKTKGGLIGFIRDLRCVELMTAQAYYVETFDRGRSLSLHLFEHVHGESRDRGQAMVDLQNMYRGQGLEIGANELPDYLPLFLEFCSMLDGKEAREWLADVEHILQLLHARLVERDNRYAVVVGALTNIAGSRVIPTDLLRRARSEERDDTPQALDRAWAEEPVTFGGGSCPPQCSALGGQAEESSEKPVQWLNKSGVGGDGR